MKIVTMAVAAVRLGWDYRFETRLEALSTPAGGVLSGDLFVVGTGDPTIAAQAGDPAATYRAWAGQLKAAGISRITGRLIGDDDAFDDDRFGDGWSWDDFVYGYAAPVGALQFDENTVELSVKPGTAVGAPAAVELRSSGSDVVLATPQVATVAAGTPTDIDIARFPGRAALYVAGAIAVDARAYVTRVAVDNPTRHAVTVLRDVLRAEGVAVDGDAVDIDEAPDADALKASAPARRVIWRHTSPPLAEIGRTLMKTSQNLYAETVFRALALRPGPADVKTARERAADTLRRWGVASGQFSIADGSGLSRLNFLSAATIVRILESVARDAGLAAAFEATLPIAGRDGTLSGRMKATRAEANAVGKTGTLSSVRSLSGYVRTADGERLVFAFLVNNFLAPSSAIDAVVDHAVERLANLRR
jgi:D-alanyl-D-alanine carboxypeptidase/D-alanyl-D-alanine-endopeptidase (penicillin-binding protein 4)